MRCSLNWCLQTLHWSRSSFVLFFSSPSFVQEVCEGLYRLPEAAGRRGERTSCGNLRHGAGTVRAGLRHRKGTCARVALLVRTVDVGRSPVPKPAELNI